MSHIPNSLRFLAPALLLAIACSDDGRQLPPGQPSTGEGGSTGAGGAPATGTGGGSATGTAGASLTGTAGESATGTAGAGDAGGSTGEGGTRADGGSTGTAGDRTGAAGRGDGGNRTGGAGAGGDRTGAAGSGGKAGNPGSTAGKGGRGDRAGAGGSVGAGGTGGAPCASTASCRDGEICTTEDGVCNAPPGCNTGVVCPAVCYGNCRPKDGAPGNACTTDTDCRLAADYCTGCDCRALGPKQMIPACPGPGVACLRDPCGGHKARCASGRCVVE